VAGFSRPPPGEQEVLVTATGQEQHFDSDVVVVGAGPVGLTLAADLASRGARVVITELRGYLEAPNVKCNHVSARSAVGAAATVSATAISERRVRRAPAAAA
jgi:flavin-dependent dehydrogenase